MKAVGIIMVAIGYFFILVLFLAILLLLTQKAELEPGIYYAFGYYLGQTLVLLFFSWTTYLFIKHGKKFIKKAHDKRKIILDLEQIGK